MAFKFPGKRKTNETRLALWKLQEALPPVSNRMV